MHSFQNIIVLLFALVACVFAAETESYDATVYITSTVFRVNTVTMSGSSPSAAVANQTSTIHPPSATYVIPTSSFSSNGTTIKPTGSVTQSASPEFTGAASSLNVNALVAALAAGVSYLVL